MTVFIGGAWPYANGSLHLGHISSLLPGDILARYYRIKGEKVLYVSGSDCNGTPISIKAKQEGVTPKEIADRYHCEFHECFTKLGFTFDCYTRTDTQHHHKVVQEIFLALLDKGLIYKKEIEQAYCENYQQFLPDRYVEGVCPHCKKQARGDQCDHCSSILDPLDLLEKKCALCGEAPIIRKTEHFYFALSSFQSELNKYVSAAKQNNSWRANAIQLTERYLREGLQNRAVSRDLPNGVSVPVTGYEDKKIYVWIEAVSGYLSASKQWAKESGKNDKDFWRTETKTYYVHGKDNIPFHTIIWPAILKGIGNQALPEQIISNEYLTLEKKKISTSKNWAVWVPDFLKSYQADSIRYFLSINAPEKHDTDFSWREFIYSHNSELLGAYGNFVNRTLKFIDKYYEGHIPNRLINNDIENRINNLYVEVGEFIEKGCFKLGLEKIFEFVRDANKYFDLNQPWKQINEDVEGCKETMSNCVFIIANLAQLLAPFLPFSSEEVKNTLGINQFEWKTVGIPSKQVTNIKPLFERIELKRIEEELEKLNNQLR
ncbi:methionine--tRNA ligase [Peribacillus alkalitolerans]|uniref:methionine--tRNA ligase n=1 Tax=Peribacillus alkalitolerans TaxID=1550385 RepID=UPI0013D7E63E|nr:methionine--tRNA ligase [Peribacillus alkalitolerans]